MAFVQKASNQNDATGTSLVATFSGSVVGGHTVFVDACWDNSSGATVTITDALGTVYSKTTQVDDTSNGQSMATFKGVPATAITAVTANFSVSSLFRRITTCEDSAAFTLITSNTGVFGSATTATNGAVTASVTPTASGQYVRALISINDAGATYTAGTSPNAFTLRVQDASTLGARIGVEDFTTTGIPAIAPTWTSSAASSFGMMSITTVWSVSGGGGSTIALTGASTASLSSSANARAKWGLNAHPAAVLASTANARAKYGMTGSLAATLGTTGNDRVTRGFSASATATLASAGSARVTRGFSASALATLASSGTARVKWGFSGSSTLTLTTSGSLTVTGGTVVSLSGSATAMLGTTGNARTAVRFSGASSARLSTTGNARAKYTFQGAATATLSTAGNIQVAVPISGGPLLSGFFFGG